MLVYVCIQYHTICCNVLWQFGDSLVAQEISNSLGELGCLKAPHRPLDRLLRGRQHLCKRKNYASNTATCLGKWAETFFVGSLLSKRLRFYTFEDISWGKPSFRVQDVHRVCFHIQCFACSGLPLVCTSQWSNGAAPPTGIARELPNHAWVAETRAKSKQISSGDDSGTMAKGVGFQQAVLLLWFDAA